LVEKVINPFNTLRCYNASAVSLATC